MTLTDQLIWEEKEDAQTKAMFSLMNLKNKIAKKDLRLAFAQGTHSAYPEIIESMARFLSSKYNIKTANNHCYKVGDKNGKKGYETKSEDKDNNNTGTTGVHVGETTTPQDSSKPSDRSSIGAHISDVTKPDV